MPHERNTIVSMLLFCMLAFGGCNVGPDYHPQDSNMPSEWAGLPASVKDAGMHTDIVHWWTVFNDPNLSSLIDKAVVSNLNIKQAEARILQARAQRGVAASGFWPTADATGSASRARSPGLAAPSKTGNLFQTGLDAAWELDIFGGTRRAVEAADADIQAAEEDRRDILITLISEVALNYIELRGYQQEIIIARNNLESQRHTAEVTRQKLQAGFVGRLDVANADAQVATTVSIIPVLETSAQQTIYNLSVLLGLPPASLLKELSPASAIPAVPSDVPMCIPSELLRRRPDIRFAEAKIHSATARIGVATADLFPKFKLTGNMNFQNTDLNKLTEWKNRSWTLGSSVDWQIFSAGRVSSNIKVQKALRQQSVIAYQQIVLTALQDVENALVAYSKEHERRKALEDAVKANTDAVKYSTQLYSQGQTDFLNVLNAQRSLFVSQQALAASIRNLSTDLVALYKALGGGWDPNKSLPQK